MSGAETETWWFSWVGVVGREGAAVSVGLGTVSRDRLVHLHRVICDELDSAAFPRGDVDVFVNLVERHWMEGRKGGLFARSSWKWKAGLFGFGIGLGWVLIG